MTKVQLEMMFKGLIATAVEVIYVQGWEDAREEVQRLTELVGDLELFWDSDGEITGVDWGMEIAKAVERARENMED